MVYDILLSPRQQSAGIDAVHAAYYNQSHRGIFEHDVEMLALSLAKELKDGLARSLLQSCYAYLQDVAHGRQY